MGGPLSGVPHVGRRTETRKDVIKYIYGGRLSVILRPKKLRKLCKMLDFSQWPLET